MEKKFSWFNNENKTRFIEIDNRIYTPFMGQTLRCEQCGNFVFRPQQGWMERCNRCGTLISFFHPTPIQLLASLCQANILFNIGAVGSGKTTISSFIWSTQLRMIPGSKLICAAQTMDQLTRNAIPELEKFFHKSEIVKKIKNDYWVLKNGAIIEFWVSDDPDKLRSANANFIWLVEANTPKMQLFFNEATSRIRNQLGLIYEYDEKGNIIIEKTKTGQKRPKVKYNRNMIIVEGNPKRGAWFNNSIMNSHTILYTTNVRGMDKIRARSKPTRTVNQFTGLEQNADMVGILNASYDNPLLDEKYFINMRASCKTQEEYDQKVYCDITSQDGLVFKEVVNKPQYYFKNIQQVIHNPHLKFVETMDPGGSNAANDPDAYILGVFDTLKKKLTLLEELKVSGLTLEQTAERIRRIRMKWGYNPHNRLIFTADNALGRSSKQDRRFSLKTDYEIRLGTPITTISDKGIAAGNALVKMWYQNFAIEINESMEDFKKEIYGYEEFEVAKVIKGTDQVRYDTGYTEVNNHLLDALRYLIVGLEALGYRQDQALIDLNQQYMRTGSLPELKPETYEQGIRSKSDIRNFLPTSLNGFVDTSNSENKPPIRQIKF